MMSESAVPSSRGPKRGGMTSIPTSTACGLIRSSSLPASPADFDFDGLDQQLRMRSTWVPGPASPKPLTVPRVLVPVTETRPRARSAILPQSVQSWRFHRLTQPIFGEAGNRSPGAWWSSIVYLRDWPFGRESSLALAACCRRCIRSTPNRRPGRVKAGTRGYPLTNWPRPQGPPTESLRAATYSLARTQGLLMVANGLG